MADKPNQASLPEPKELYFYGFVIFDSGNIFDFSNVAEEVQFANEMVQSLQASAPEFEWFCEGVSFTQSSTIEMYSPPNISSFLGAKCDNYPLQKKIDLIINDALTVPLIIDEMTSYFYIFNTGVIRYRLRVPEAYWQDLTVLRAVRQFMVSPVAHMPITISQVFNPLVKKLRHALQLAVEKSQPPQFQTPFFDFISLMGSSDEARWTHSTCVAIMPADFRPESSHFKPVLLDVDPQGIRNFAQFENHFAFVEAADSLICVPDKIINGKDAKTQVWENWVRYIRLHQYTWKMAWELERGLYAILNQVTHNLKHKQIQHSAGDSFELNALLNYVRLTLDAHKPRNVSSTYHTIHFLEGIATTWKTNEIIADMNDKMADLKEIVQQLDQLASGLRAKSMERFLIFVGVFGLGSLALDYMKSMSFGTALGDFSMTFFMVFLIVTFSYIGFRLMK